MTLGAFIEFLQGFCVLNDVDDFIELFIQEFREEVKDIYRSQKLRDP